MLFNTASFANFIYYQFISKYIGKGVLLGLFRRNSHNVRSAK